MKHQYAVNIAEDTGEYVLNDLKQGFLKCEIVLAALQRITVDSFKQCC